MQSIVDLAMQLVTLATSEIVGPESPALVTISKAIGRVRKSLYTNRVPMPM